MGGLQSTGDFRRTVQALSQQNCSNINTRRQLKDTVYMFCCELYTSCKVSESLRGNVFDDSSKDMEKKHPEGWTQDKKTRGT